MIKNKQFRVRDMIRNLMDYNLDAEFEIIGNDGYPVNISEFNVGWVVNDGAECDENERDIYIEKHTCTKLVLYPNNEGMEMEKND